MIIGNRSKSNVIYDRPFLWTSVYYVLYWLGDHDCIMVFLLHKIQLMYSLLLTWASFIKEMSHKTLTLLTGCLTALFLQICFNYLSTK